MEQTDSSEILAQVGDNGAYCEPLDSSENPIASDMTNANDKAEYFLDIYVTKTQDTEDSPLDLELKITESDEEVDQFVNGESDKDYSAPLDKPLTGKKEHCSDDLTKSQPRCDDVILKGRNMTENEQADVGDESCAGASSNFDCWDEYSPNAFHVECDTLDTNGSGPNVTNNSEYISSGAWVDFEIETAGKESSESQTKPMAARPTRPPPPKRPPPRPLPPTSKLEKISKGDDIRALPDGMGDDQSVLIDKKKVKGLSSKKIVKGIVTTKRDKKDKRAKNEDIADFKKFTSDIDGPVNKNSEEWHEFQALLDRSTSAVVVTQKKMTKMCNFSERDLCEASQDPWIVEHNTDANEQSTFVKPMDNWIGFDDDFSVASNENGNETHESLQSQLDLPVPPINSQKESIEGQNLLCPFVIDTHSPISADDQIEMDQSTLTLTMETPKSSIIPLLCETDDMTLISLTSQESHNIECIGNNPEEIMKTENVDLMDGFLNAEEPIDPFEAMVIKDRELQLLGEEQPVSESVQCEHDNVDMNGGHLNQKWFTAMTGDMNEDFSWFDVDAKAKEAIQIEDLSTNIPDLINDEFEFNPREHRSNLNVEPAQDTKPNNQNRARPRPHTRATESLNNSPFKIDLVMINHKLVTTEINESGSSSNTNPFAPSKNPFTANVTEPVISDSLIAFDDDGNDDGSNGDGSYNNDSGDHVANDDNANESFNPFATILESDQVHQQKQQQQQSNEHLNSFNPFQTIHDEDAFDVDLTQNTCHVGEELSPNRFNPFNKEPPLDESFDNLDSGFNVDDEKSSLNISPSESSLEDNEELHPLPSFYRDCIRDGWKLLLRQPTKKKLTQNRFWKPVFVKLLFINNVPVLKVYSNEQCNEQIQELPLQASYNLCDMGLQTFDQFGKCHTVKMQYVFYREKVGVKTDRITPTLSDLTRVRDFKGLKDLVHKPKTTMILDHAPQASELLKFGGLDIGEFKSFIRSVEDAMFKIKSQRERSQTYTKDEITVNVVDEYYAMIDKDGHIGDHRGRVRIFCLAFLTGMPYIEIGLNDKKRRGKEVVSRHDIIPIKTEEWIKIEGAEFYHGVDSEIYDKNKILRIKPLDACQFELMRFRVRPRLNKELPLQIHAQMSVIEKHVEIRADVLIPGYHSNSKRSGQTPCEDIMIHFPIPEPWIYLFRVEKRFRYGSVKSQIRKPGKIKGLERLTQMAQGILPPSLIEVSTGQAKYEHIFHAIIWRINRLPERNEGAYKTHLFTCKLDLGPHDVMPENFSKEIYVQYNMPNSTVSRAQVRSISVNPVEDENPDKWVHHTAKYEYTVEMDFSDRPPKPPVPLNTLSESIPVITDDKLECDASEAVRDDSDDTTDSDSD